MIKQSLMTIVGLCAISVAQAAPLFQAGSIEEGKTWTINPTTGDASYYADGKSGKVEFHCLLSGQTDADGHPPQALLKAGKNFLNHHNIPWDALNQGDNGPFIWTLTDNGENNGNIKIEYIYGSNVTVQCSGKRR